MADEQRLVATQEHGIRSRNRCTQVPGRHGNSADSSSWWLLRSRTGQRSICPTWVAEVSHSEFACKGRRQACRTIKWTDSWILRSCSDQVQRLVPVDSLHVRTADGLEELAVQLPSISSAYCPDTSPEFGLWKSFWRRSDAKMPQVTYDLSDLIQS